MANGIGDGLPRALDADAAIKIFLTPEREQLKKRIETRFDAMLDDGALEEVRALDARHLPETLPAMKAHGVPWLRKFFRGEISREDAAEGAVMDTRRYAKRQVTWFRNQMPGWTWVKPEEGAAAVETALKVADLAFVMPISRPRLHLPWRLLTEFYFGCQFAYRVPARLRNVLQAKLNVSGKRCLRPRFAAVVPGDLGR